MPEIALAWQKLNLGGEMRQKPCRPAG